MFKNQIVLKLKSNAHGCPHQNLSKQTTNYAHQVPQKVHAGRPKGLPDMDNLPDHRFNVQHVLRWSTGPPNKEDKKKTQKWHTSSKNS